MYLVLFFVGTILVSLSPFLIRMLTKKKVFYKPVRIFVPIITVILFLMVASSLFMNEYNWYWRGYKTTVYLFIGLTFFWIWNYVITSFQNKFYQIFIEVILFLALVISTTICVYNLIDYGNNRIYEDKLYRLETFNGIISRGDILPDLYIKKGLFEKKMILYPKVEYFGLHKSEVETCKIVEQENGYSVTFVLEDGSELKTSTMFNDTIKPKN